MWSKRVYSGVCGRRTKLLKWIQLCTRPKRWLVTNNGVAHNKEQNVILTGSPGCGKTTVGRILGEKLGRPVLDIDDDHLEPYWGMPVSQKLQDVGSDNFVEAEGQALLNFKATGSVVSLTGSNAMHEAGMNHVAKSGTVIFLDVNMVDIVERLERMKVNRIVGQNDGSSMWDILKFRQQFYEKSYDVRIICEENESPEKVANKILKRLQEMEMDNGYISTRGGDKEKKQEVKLTFQDIILKGLAPDGGLFVPGNSIPRLTSGEWSRLVNLTYQERAQRILERWINPNDMSPQALWSFINEAYHEGTFSCSKVFPVRHLENDQYLLELFHGPTASFKDAALQLMPQFFVDSLKKRGMVGKTKYLILVATSGDTGGAVLDGFTRHAGESGVGVMVLYPSHGVSEIQQRQMTSLTDNNAAVLGVKSDFDFCQTFVKNAFTDGTLERDLQTKFNCKLSAANSISWGRLLPQVVYHASAYLDLVQSGIVAMGDKVDHCIPTGNFGNILAAYYSKEMGIPFDKLICASNSNNVLRDFIRTGTYDLTDRSVIKTSSPAIDILVSSNLERFLYHVTDSSSVKVRQYYDDLKGFMKFQVSDEALKSIQSVLCAGWCPESECGSTIRKSLEKTGYLLDPHTAVAKTVGDRFVRDKPMLIASTAHPAKFAHDILRFLGRNITNCSVQDMFGEISKISSYPQMHESLAQSMKREGIHKTNCNADYDAVVSEIMSFANRI